MLSRSSAIGAAFKAGQPVRHTVEKTYLNPKTLSFQARQRRFEIVRPMIDRIIARKGFCRIADIGGTEYYWEICKDFIEHAPIEIHLFNLYPKPASRSKFVSHFGNACDLSANPDSSFDLVHSNSVIEHVGGWKQAADMAREVRRLAPAYYVQTPNFWFPYEPHFRFPLFQFLPEQLRYRLLMRYSLGFGGRRETVDAAMRGVQSVSLLDFVQMRELFPDAELVREYFGPWTKSLMAIRDPYAPQATTSR